MTMPWIGKISVRGGAQAGKRGLLIQIWWPVLRLTIRLWGGGGDATPDHWLAVRRGMCTASDTGGTGELVHTAEGLDTW